MSQPPKSVAVQAGSHPADPAAGSAGDSSMLPPSTGGRFEGVSEILGIQPLIESRDPLVGRTIGDVTLVAVIAEGGMGRVYEGRQRTPDRPVAVKILRPGFVTQEGVKRFAREANLLGSLRHPNIAQVFWAGACDVLGSAVPFIVMELVPGAVPITEFSRQQRLDATARVALFRKVCSAVAHGHAAGIVHRDLKPGNVLIDSVGEPKLIDFGIARLVDTAGDSTALTECGRLVGTVQYMSPEQITGDSTDVNPRTDVYALGILLHELLAGRRPYEIDPRRVFDAARIIRSRKPGSLATADGRRSSPELDRIVEKCLAIDPAARYGHAAEVAAAIDAAVGVTTLGHTRPLRHEWLKITLASVTALAVVSSLLASGIFRPPDNRAHRRAPGRAQPPAAGGPAELTMAEAMAAAPIDGTLYLQDRTHVSADVATALVNRSQAIRMDGLRALDYQLATIFGRNRRGLNFSGLKTVSAEVAAALAATGGALCLDGVESLDTAAARALATHRDWLNLTGLQALPANALAELVRHGGHGMAIRVPGALDRERAEIIARHRGVLYLIGLDTIDEDAAKILAGHRGPVHVDAARVSPEVDRLLAELR